MTVYNFSDFIRSNSLHLDLREVLQSNPRVLLGVSSNAEEILKKLNVRTIFDLGMSAIFNAAELIANSKSFPQNIIARYGQVPTDYIDDAFTKTKPDDLASQPVSVLRGIDDVLAQEIAMHMGFTTIREMSLWASYQAAKRMIILALNPEADADIDSEAPADLVPKTGEYPTDKVYYRTVVMINTPDENTQEITGPLDLGNPLKTGFNKPTTGAVLTFSQAWYPKAVTLGQLLYSLPLAPGESTKIAIIDFTRHSTSRAEEDISQTERLSHTMVQSRAISEIANATADETQTGNSIVVSGGASTEVGFAGGGTIPFISGILGGSFGAGGNVAATYTHTYSHGNRELSSKMQQNIQNSTQQNAFSSRNKRAAIVTEASQHEREQISTRTVTNYNHMHAMSVQYYEVVQMYQTQVRLEKCDRCIFIPMKVFRFDENIISRFKGILYRSALSERIRQLLVYSIGSVTADLALEPGYKFVEED